MGFENGHIARVTLSATKGTRTQVNTLHYDLIGTLTQSAPSLQALADRLTDDLMTPYRALFDNTWTINPIEVVDELDPQHPTDTRDSAVGGAGGAGSKSVGSDELPPGSCVVVTLRTAHIGRRFRGRMFISGTPVEGDQNAGVWSSLWLTQVESFVNAIPVQPDLIDGPDNGASAHWVVYSRSQRGGNIDPYANEVTSATPRDLVHFLRRRALFS